MGVQLGLNSLCVEWDCSNAVALVFCSEMEGLICELIEALGYIHFQFLGREANALAHALTKWYSSRGVSAVWKWCLPSLLFHALCVPLLMP